MNKKQILKKRHIREKERIKRSREIARRQLYFKELQKINVRSLSPEEATESAPVIEGVECFLCSKQITAGDDIADRIFGFRASQNYFAHREHFYLADGKPVPNFDGRIVQAGQIIRRTEMKKRTGMDQPE